MSCRTLTSLGGACVRQLWSPEAWRTLGHRSGPRVGLSRASGAQARVSAAAPDVCYRPIEPAPNRQEKGAPTIQFLLEIIRKNQGRTFAQRLGPPDNNVAFVTCDAAGASGTNVAAFCGGGYYAIARGKTMTQWGNQQFPLHQLYALPSKPERP